MSFGGLIITNKGRALQAKVQAGAPLHFNRIGVGDGNNGSTLPADMIALVSEKQSLAITKLKTQVGGKAVIGGVLSNAGLAVGFYFREIGLFAQDPDDGEILYSYDNSGATAEYIPPDNGPVAIEKQIDTITIIGNAANVSATISSGVYAAVVDFDAHTADQAAHGATSAATANKIVRRDVLGRFKAADPAAADDVATKGSVEAAIAALVNSSPATLDTLNELATALGNDPNFATTMANALAVKASTASVTAIDSRLTKVDSRYKKTVVSSDANGKPTQIDYKRLDNTLFKRAVSSNPDANGNYLTLVITEYDAPGTAIIPNGTITYTFTYDAAGNGSHNGGVAS